MLVGFFYFVNEGRRKNPSFLLGGKKQDRKTIKLLVIKNVP